jgi:hypothetical protein
MSNLICPSLLTSDPVSLRETIIAYINNVCGQNEMLFESELETVDKLRNECLAIGIDGALLDALQL